MPPTGIANQSMNESIFLFKRFDSRLIKIPTAKAIEAAYGGLEMT